MCHKSCNENIRKNFSKKLENECKGIEDQSGFLAGKSCIDHIFAITQIFKIREKKTNGTYIREF